ncbi:MAG: DNA-processing protein DprA [Armatimonadota bacterium]
MEPLLTLQRLARARLPAGVLRRLLETLSEPATQISTDSDALSPAQRERVRTALADESEEAIARRACELGIRAVTVGHPDYPKELLPFEDAPAVLFVRGSRIPPGPYAAVVGSRRPDNYGLEQASRFTRALVSAGFTIVSGGAAGIDAISHATAMDCGGRTIAVLGCGPDITYPVCHRDLFRRILAGDGAIVAEFPPGTKPEPWHFPSRNRIIAAWSIVTLVIEAPEHSGALITARNAAEYGREVLVVPGPVDTGRSRGCHQLIVDGATLVDRPEDVVEIARARAGLLPETGSSAGAPEEKELPSNLSVDEILLFHAAGTVPLAFDALIGKSGLAAEECTVAATLLELKGLLCRDPGNRWRRAPGWAA